MNPFEEHRPLLFGLAYRLLGSAMEAEDILQETYLRCRMVDWEQISAAKAYLCKIVTNLCLDQLKSAQAQREIYVGEWLPEPIFTPDEGDDTLSLGLLLLMERLSPLERAVFTLREAFDYDYAAIGDLLAKESAACRQLYHRAKTRLDSARVSSPSPAQNSQALVNQFIMAVSEGDMAGLLRVLAPEVGVWSDGGGKVTAARHPVFGAEKVSAMLLGFKRFITPDMTLDQGVVNSSPALILRSNGQISNVMVLDIHGASIRAVRFILNPDKLRYINQQARIT